MCERRRKLIDALAGERRRDATVCRRELRRRRGTDWTLAGFPSRWSWCRDG